MPVAKMGVRSRFGARSTGPPRPSCCGSGAGEAAAVVNHLAAKVRVLEIVEQLEEPVYAPGLYLMRLTKARTVKDGKEGCIMVSGEDGGGGRRPAARQGMEHQLREQAYLRKEGAPGSTRVMEMQARCERVGLTRRVLRDGRYVQGSHCEKSISVPPRALSYCCGLFANSMASLGFGGHAGMVQCLVYCTVIGSKEWAAE